jgi:DeoR/GlpR family transcriptional regulator of sugar metabolism
MIDAADVTYLVADSTKIGKNSLASLGALSLIDYLITDPDIDPKHLALFTENEVEVILARD